MRGNRGPTPERIDWSRGLPDQAATHSVLCPHLNPIERLWGLMHRNERVGFGVVKAQLTGLARHNDSIEARHIARRHEYRRSLRSVGGGLPFRAESAPLHMPNMIWLCRRPILDYWSDHEEALGAVIAHVLVHEIGHHFGLSDDDMEAIEAQAE